jgi:hypothetical protein
MARLFMGPVRVRGHGRKNDQDSEDPTGRIRWNRPGVISGLEGTDDRILSSTTSFDQGP